MNPSSLPRYPTPSATPDSKAAANLEATADARKATIVLVACQLAGVLVGLTTLDMGFMARTVGSSAVAWWAAMAVIRARLGPFGPHERLLCARCGFLALGCGFLTWLLLR